MTEMKNAGQFGCGNLNVGCNLRDIVADLITLRIALMGFG
jgi:hypothetical protein